MNRLYVLRYGNKNYLEYKLSLIYLIYLHLMNAQRKHSMIQVLLDFCENIINVRHDLFKQ